MPKGDEIDEEIEADAPPMIISSAQSARQATTTITASPSPSDDATLGEFFLATNLRSDVLIQTLAI
jgi:hypothetical protein